MENLNNQKPPKSWLIESILLTLCCCLPLGIAGIVYALKVKSLFNAGDINKAMRYSEEAKNMVKIGFIIGLVTWILNIFLIIIVSI